MLNLKLLIIGGGWMVAVLIWAAWRLRNAGAESMPAWLRALFTGCYLLTLWGAARLAMAYTAGMLGAFAQFYSMIIYMAGFLGVFVLWHKHILGFFASPITSLIDGGTEAPIPKPAYSQAIALRKQGEFDRALEAVENELLRFPNDSQGWLLKAEILAINLRQPQLGILTLQEFMPKADSATVSAILLQQASIQLKQLADPKGARDSLQQVCDQYPGTEVARLALQQLAHLPTEAWLQGNPLGDRESLPVEKHSVKIGLVADHGASMLRPESTPEERSQELALRLVECPTDDEAREKLARLYMDELGRPDLAHQELEALIATPGQRDRDIVRWINLTADAHLKSPEGLEGARLALQRIIERFPGSAGAQLASQRLSVIQRDISVHRPEETLKLGPRLGNIGLDTERRFSAKRANLPGLLPEPETEETAPPVA